jgi:hypothetical protein
LRRHDKAALGRPFQGWDFFAHLTQGDAALCPGLYYFAPFGLLKTEMPTKFAPSLYACLLKCRIENVALNNYGS